MTTITDSKQVSANSKKNKRTIFISAFCFLLSAFCCMFSASFCFAEEKTNIVSESLEYNKETSTYIAKGKVQIQRADEHIEADEMTYNDLTSETVATGNVKYTEKDASFTASKAELNLDDKTGILYDAEVLIKKGNFHIKGKIIEKKGEKYYTSPRSAFTTCDAPVPAWCFSGKNVDAVVENTIKAKDVTFRIMDVPVFYTPYFRAPFLADRKTGFLTPYPGYSNTKGFYFDIPFYWAISENRDMTFTLNEYSKRGLGEDLELRYLEPGGIQGKWWFSHLRDRVLDKDFLEFRGLHDQRSQESLGGYLNINLINEKNYYNEFGRGIEVRTNRFLESTGEINLPFSNSRAYLLSQYWVDLESNSIAPSQKLPEAGYVLNPTKIGHFWISATTTFTNFGSSADKGGQRIDIFPRILHTFGNDIQISQALGLRETAYSLQGSDDDNSPHKEALEYNLTAHTRLLKRYESFTHIVEPSLSYTLITDSENNLSVFDSTELFKRTSTVELSLLNRFLNRDGEFMVFRASQGFDTFLGNQAFLPFKLELGLKKPVSFRFDVNYNLQTGKIDSTNSDISVTISDVFISMGQRYDRSDDTEYYTGNIKFHPYKPLYLEGRIWYDEKEKQVRESAVALKYLKQCWGLSLEVINRPGEFNVRIMFELKGLSRSIKT
jgi:LPS-assembly protein